MELNVEDYGQVFTRDDIVEKMINMIQNKGVILEPSGGDGAFSNKLDNCVSIELDEQFKDLHTHNIDFFRYPISNKFPTIIGNPPYVKYNDILDSTQLFLDLENFDKRTNLYNFFIEKCYKHLTDNGEIIFITPRDFIKSTSCVKLNDMLYKNGTITHFYDYGDEMLFKGFSPNVAIWRYEKNNFSHKTETFDGIKKFNNFNGQLSFTDGDYTEELNKLFYIKVGGVSGKDDIYVHENGNIEVVCSSTISNGKLKRMYYDKTDDYIESHKSTLISRGIKSFTEDNWWKWGRDFYKSSDDRIYVNGKTRVKKPFFKNECNLYDGSILGIFPLKDDIDLDKAITELNNLNWNDLGFKVGGRFVFAQRSLNNIKLPKGFYDKIKKVSK